MNLKFDKIRPYNDNEINAALRSIIDEPVLKGIMSFTFPDMKEEAWKSMLAQINTIDEFQRKVIYIALKKVLAISSDGLTTTGFDQLDPQKAYLFISNHRDILLDTSLINVALVEHNMMTTNSAIGDNLVKRPLLYTLAKTNRNFLVFRDLAPRELLEASVTLSEYIFELINHENRSVWIAQREGRTKDGNDATHPGVLKMLSLAADKENLSTYFRKLNIVPISISYEYDPTDILKLPELMANLHNETYTKSENEDFNTIYKGIIGQKKHIHIHAGTLAENDFQALEAEPNSNKQIRLLTQTLDNHIVNNYKLWATNYIAYDWLYQTDKYQSFYTTAEKDTFVQRITAIIDTNDKVLLHQLLGMYANPVVNKEKFNTKLINS